MNRFFARIARIDHNYYAFISGVVISLSLEIFMNVLLDENIPKHWPVLVATGVLSFLSSLLWSMIAWDLDSIQNLAFREAPDFVDVDAVWTELLSPRLPKLKAYFLLATVSFGASLALIPLKFVF